MAVTIYDEPQLIAPAGNPLVFTFSSDQTAQPNFSFVVEVYIMGQLRLTQEVFRQFNTLGRIDVSEIIMSEIINPTISNNFETSVNLNTYSITVYEKYGTPAVVDYFSSVSSSGLKPLNSSLEYKNWINWNYDDYDPNLTSNALFLTDFPRLSKPLCGMYENFYLSYFDFTQSNPVTIYCALYDIQGNVIAFDSSIPLSMHEFNIVNVGPQSIIANSSITQNDFDNCYKYYIYLELGGTQRTEIFFIYMDTDCKRYQTYRLHWLNKLGSWDSFTFALVSIESATVQAYDYQRDPGVWDGTSYTYPLYSGQKINFAKTKSKQLVLNSDWISESVQNWLVESLFDSPLVYLEQNNGTEFEPVKVTNSNYQLKTRRRDGLMQEQVTIERTYTYRSQLN